MVVYKQDMPPPGGYAPINFQKVPPKIINIWWKVGAFVGITAIGWILWYEKRRIRINERIEQRCANIAMLPLFYAENDRAHLKQLKKNRDYEEKLMKDYPKWEVGKFYDIPVLMSVKPNEYFKQYKLEYFAHSDPKYLKELQNFTFDI